MGMKQKTTQILYDYWNQARAGRLAPRRLEIEPSRIAGILPETFMLERGEAGAYPFRLAGTRLCEMFGWELRGTDFLDGWSAPDRSVLARQLTSVCEQGAVCVLTLDAGAGSNQHVELEALLLPLVHAGKTIARVLGAMAPTTSPHWLGHARVETKRLTRHELVWPDGRPHSVVERAGWNAPFLPPAPDSRPVKDERRSFRVLDGGRGGTKREDK
jgi:hypothetical protein